MRALVFPAVVAVLLVVIGLSLETLRWFLVLGVLGFAATVATAVPLARRECLPSDPDQRG